MALMMRVLPRYLRCLSPCAPGVTTLTGLVNHQYPISTQSTPGGALDQHNTRRNFSKLKDSLDAELFLGDIGVEYGEEESFLPIRINLFPDSEDQIIQDLSSLETLAEVFDLMKNLSHPTSEQITQALSTIHHMKKMLEATDTSIDELLTSDKRYLDMQTSYPALEMDPDSLLAADDDDGEVGSTPGRKILNKMLMEDRRFKDLMSLIEERIADFGLRDTSFIFMVLSKAGLKLTHPLAQKLYMRLIEKADSLDITTLSFLAVSIRGKSRFGLLPVVPSLCKCFDLCETTSDLKKLATCVSIISPIISEKILDRFRDKFLEFVADGKFSSLEDIRRLTKQLAFYLSNILWHNDNPEYTITLVRLHEGHVSGLAPLHVLLLHRVTQILGQSESNLYKEIYDRLCQLYTRRHNDGVGGSPFHVIGGVSLSSFVSEIVANKVHPIPDTITDQDLDDILRSCINLGDVYLRDLFKIIDYRFEIGRPVSPDILSQFWGKVLHVVEKDKRESGNLLLRRGNHWSWPYFPLEEFTEIVLKAARETDRTDVFVEQFSALTRLKENIPEDIIEKFFNLLPQLKPFSINNIARSLRDPYKRRKKNKQDPVHLLDQELSLALMKTTMSYFEAINHKHIKPRDYLYLLNAYTCLTTVFDQDHYKIVCDVMKSIIPIVAAHPYSNDTVVTSNILNQRPPYFELPEITDAIQEQFSVHLQSCDLDWGTKLISPLVYSFKVNRRPSDEMMESAAKVVSKNLERISSPHVLNVCIALSSFQYLPEYLAKRVFSSEYMDQLDKEIGTRPQNSKFEQSLRKKVIVLNRACVLQFPNYKIPWLQHDYGKKGPDNAELQRNRSIKNEVFEELCAALGGWRYVQEDTFSPYMNHVHFEVCCDSSGAPMDMHTSRVQQPVTKIAVQVYDELDYTLDTQRLTGWKALEVLHLSLQGYQVLPIGPTTWNSMFLADSQAKQQFLNQAVQALQAK